MYAEEDYLQLSGIQHYCFCKRQWGLIHINQSWIEDSRTAAGGLFHKNVDEGFHKEKRGNTTQLRSVYVSSSTLGFSGRCDIVELVRNDEGGGKMSMRPVEYKVGRRKIGNWDRVQLCAEAMALEETFGTEIQFGFLFYGGERRRTEVEISKELRSLALELSREMHDAFNRGSIHPPEYSSKCDKCSLFDICMPKFEKGLSVEDFLLKTRREI